MGCLRQARPVTGGGMGERAPIKNKKEPSEGVGTAEGSLLPSTHHSEASVPA